MGAQPPQTVKRFIEKPDEAAAQTLLDAGSYLWNAGIFMFRAHDMVSAFSDYAPELVRPVTELA